LQIKIEGEEIKAPIDTGCEMSILNENLYNKLRHARLQCLELPTQNVNLVSAYNMKSKIVKKQEWLKVNFGGAKLDQVFLSEQLLTEVILGLKFLINYEPEISFPERRIRSELKKKFSNSNSQVPKKHRLVVSVTWD